MCDEEYIKFFTKLATEKTFQLLERAQKRGNYEPIMGMFAGCMCKELNKKYNVPVADGSFITDKSKIIKVRYDGNVCTVSMDLIEAAK